MVLVGIRCAILGRNLPVTADGLAYLDLARAYLHHNWPIAVNGYWGPLYAWLIAATLAVFHPASRHEFAAVRALNVLILILCLYAFGGFWRSVAWWNRKASDDVIPLADASPLGWMLLGYVLFLTRVVWFTEQVNPDLLVCGMVLLIAEQLFKLDNGQPRAITHYLSLGVLVVVGFYAKAILFYFGVFVLLVLTIRGVHSRHYRGVITAALLFALLVSPYVAALSRTLGHFTVGDSGRLNYAWFVDGPETGPWPNGSVSAPFFPGPILLNSPRVFRIPRLEGVTYAPWYDAARFDKRSRAIFNVRGQLRQLATNLRFLKENFLGTESAILVCLIILISSAPKSFLHRFARAWFCTVPVLMVIGMYLLVHLVERFILGFSLVLWGVCFSCVRVPSTLKVLAGRALISAIAVFAAYTLPGLLHYLASPTESPLEHDMVIAQDLPNLGIQTGDSVAVIGDGPVAYWAHWAGVSIVAELTLIDSPSFWSGPPESQRATVRAMEASGAKAVIWRRDSNRPCPQEWVALPEDSGCMISLGPAPSHAANN